MSNESIKSSIYTKKFSENITIKIDNLKDQCLFFIENIEKNAKKYKTEIDKEKEKFYSLKTNKSKVSFTPENLISNSPITILDAPWGAGKTFFIESLCKYVINDEIKLNYIKKIIVVDSWKYSISSTIPTDFILYLVENLAASLKWKNEIKILFVNFLNTFFFSPLNKIFGTSLKFEYKKLCEMSTDETIKKLNEHINFPVLVIVDNIERIGENGWEILKTIQRLAMLNNLIFVLPMNKNRLVNEKLINSEWRIEKYINIPFYSFKQDYIGLLKKYGIDDELASIFNDLLTKQINGECLSIRELDKILLSEEHFEEKFKDKYKALITFREIWPLEEEIKEIILNDIQEMTFIIEGILKNINSFNNLFKSDEYIYISTLINKYFNSNLEVVFLSNFDFLINISNNKKDLKNYCSCLAKMRKVNFDELIKEKTKLKDEKNLIKSNNDIEIKKIENKIQKLNDWILKYDLGKFEKTVHNNEKYNKKTNELSIQITGLDEWNQKNKSLKDEIDQINISIDEIKKVKENLKEFIKNANNQITIFK